MYIKSFKTQDFEALKASHPDLYAVVYKHFKHLPNEDRGKIAGLCIEYVIQSDGNEEVFQEEIQMPLDEAFDDETF